MLLPQFRDEEVTLLVFIPGQKGRLGGEVAPPTYVPGATFQGLVTNLGTAEAVKLGLAATAQRWRVRLPAGTVLKIGDRLRFRGNDWKAELVEVRTSYTKVIAEEVR